MAEEPKQSYENRIMRTKYAYLTLQIDLIVDVTILILYALLFVIAFQFYNNDMFNSTIFKLITIDVILCWGIQLSILYNDRNFVGELAKRNYNRTVVDNFRRILRYLDGAKYTMLILNIILICVLL